MTAEAAEGEVGECMALAVEEAEAVGTTEEGVVVVEVMEVVDKIVVASVVEV